jgi:FAD:protein FMN transferase
VTGGAVEVALVEGPGIGVGTRPGGGVGADTAAFGDVGTGTASFSGRAMGSPLRLTLAGLDGSVDPAQLWQLVRDDVEASERAMSRFRDTAELVALNRSLGQTRRVSGRLYAAIAASELARRVTGGRFDPRVHDDLERLGEHGAVPGAGSTTRALSPSVRADQVDRLDPGPVADRWPRRRVVRIDRPIDLGGIGKGLALRWAARRLRSAAPWVGFLLEAGGDIVCHGRAPDGDRWRVGIEDPAGGRRLAIVELTGRAIMTSSTALRAWRSPDGRVVHHLLDPRTGEPSDGGLRSVTVAGSDPAWSEVRTKELFLIGARDVGPAARAAGLPAWWVADDGRLAMTPAARASTIWVGDESA